MTAALSAGFLALTSCASSGGDSGDGSKTGTGKGNTGQGTTVTIGVDAPLTGDLLPLGKGIANSVDLALRQANETNEVPGVTFAVKSSDDKGRPALGRRNATAFVADKSVLGVVGPLNSSVAQSMQKTFNDANLVEVSPANTTPDLTQGTSWQTGNKKRPYKSYFRTATTDAVQGPFAAQYLYSDAMKTKVFLLDDGSTYGTGLTGTFKDKFLELGGKIVGIDRVNPDAKDFAETVARVSDSGADAVYYGGYYPAAGPLSAQLKEADVKIPLIGGDAVYSPQFIDLAGDGANGSLATSVGARIEQLDSAKEFVQKYRASNYKDPYLTYGGYAYDSAWAIVQAVKTVVQENGGKLPSSGARAKITEAMQDTSFDGVTGHVSFDKFGDATNKQLTVYKVLDGAWTPVKTGTYTG